MSCDPFRQNHKRIAASKLLDVYGDLDNQNLFLSIGRIVPWAGASGSVNDNNPPTAIDSVFEDTNFWRGIFAHKRIDRADVSLVVRRYDWKPGVVYSTYDDEVDLFDDLNPSPFYVLVDEERVYKCIDNNYGSPSLNAPTHTDTRIRTLGDGYRWKFLYQIPESKRKFLTKTQGNSIGYMPIEYVEYLRTNDERILQWNVQQTAVDGEISYIRMNPDVQPFVVSKDCVFPSGENVIVSNAGIGATGLTISSPDLIYTQDKYKDMTLSIDTGRGLGQRREITSFVANNTGTSAFVTLKHPLDFGVSGGSGGSTFSIVPTIRVIGDGTSYRNSNNTYLKAADVLVRFGPTATSEIFRNQGLTTCDELVESVKLIDSIEIVDGGKDYTFASLEYAAGLHVPTGKVQMDALADPIMSPPGGHGVNPVKELGASSIMIVKEYNRSENNKVSVENEYRQFGLILNPLLTEKQVRLRFREPGLSSSFSYGITAQQSQTGSYDAAYGNVRYWLYGASGFSGSNELVLTNIRNGDFEFGGKVNNLTIINVDERRVAGTEGRRLTRLVLAPTLESGFLAGNQCRCASGNDFLDGNLVHGIGNYETSMPPSRAVGEIYRWEPTLGSNKSGYLYVENQAGEFKQRERVIQTDWFHNGFSDRGGFSGIGEITSIDTIIREGVDTYDQTTRLTVEWDGTNYFDTNSFGEDLYAEFKIGTTASANGYVVDWSAVTAGTSGTIRLTGTQGQFVAGMTAEYRVSNTESAIAEVTSVDHVGELKYRSGEILYIQNMKPIQRNTGQKEEIKIVIDF